MHMFMFDIQANNSGPQNRVFGESIGICGCRLNDCTRKCEMNDNRHETNEELDCLVTVEDGAYATCDKIDPESTDAEVQPPDHDS